MLERQHRCSSQSLPVEAPTGLYPQPTYSFAVPSRLLLLFQEPRPAGQPTNSLGGTESLFRPPPTSVYLAHLPASFNRHTLLLSAWLQLLEDPVILLHRTPLFKASFPFFVGQYLFFHACALFYQYTHFLCECTFVPIHTIDLVAALPTVAEGIQEWLSRMGCVKIGGKFAEVERPCPVREGVSGYRLLWSKSRFDLEYVPVLTTHTFLFRSTTLRSFLRARYHTL